MTKFKEDIIKCDFWHLKLGVILQYITGESLEEELPGTKKDSIKGKIPILILQGLNSINKYLEIKTWDL